MAQAEQGIPKGKEIGKQIERTRTRVQEKLPASRIIIDICVVISRGLSGECCNKSPRRDGLEH